MFTELSTRPLPARRLARRVAGSGLVGALTYPHGVDRYLELVRPRWTLNELRAEVVAVRRSATDSVTLTLAPNDLWTGFEAGQHVAVTVVVDGVRRTRFYSPAGSAHGAPGQVELTVRRHAGGLVSQHLHDHARVGTVVGLGAAAGDFVLPARRPERLLLISGGSGITPLLSMLRTLCDEGHDAPVAFLHYARGREHLAYREELAELAARHRNVRVLNAFTREDGGDLRGHFGPDHLRHVLSGGAAAEAYVCGPSALLESVRGAWSAQGRSTPVRSESFVPPAYAPSGDELGGTVRFGRSELSQASSGATLLEQAEAAGLTPAYGCRMGICHTCTCRKLAGRVRDVRSGELSSAEAESIQLCVSVPAGDVELDL